MDETFTTPTPPASRMRQRLAAALQTLSGDLDGDVAEALLQDWRLWARASQLPPAGAWRIWLMLGGRGAGKTRAGAEWVRAQVESGAARRLALIAPTYDLAREVMVEGASGLLALGGMEVTFESSRRRLSWANGAVAHLFSAERPEHLRGHQFDCAWGDEFVVWAYPEATLANLRLALRLGERPRLMITTTPRAKPALKALIKTPGSVCTVMATAENSAHLAPGFAADLRAAFSNSAFARQELDGILIEDEEDALWRRADLERARAMAPLALTRIVVALDPPAGLAGDACGIVAAGAAGEGAFRRAAVLADASAHGLRPTEWARRAINLAYDLAASTIVAEANNGGEMVRAVLHQVDSAMPVKLVHASQSKRARAEPVAALYEQGRVAHAGAFPELEDEMCGFTPHSKASPDRLDALVWALTELMLFQRAPRLRTL